MLFEPYKIVENKDRFNYEKEYFSFDGIFVDNLKFFNSFL